ncbi:helix-turn-helix transcriptional regulator [Sporichthya sp.]|uniref:helix-turn-helix domain-containing protein n=1 Tax=Sporichthya sp. TaxID=65475 RepID=UPI0017BDFC74|nr:helix-turn-helix transcriptional regulator [Sporichthya sp.]MBA3745399.1 helix-turn-helix transcriptional regulator [Sporichthya sp.]
MAETWDQMVARRNAEPGAPEAYEAAKLAYELGAQVRKQREKRGWSQQDLATAARMRQPQVARFEAGGTIPKVDTLQRLLTALGGRITVTFPPAPRPSVARGPSGRKKVVAAVELQQPRRRRQQAALD